MTAPNHFLSRYHFIPLLILLIGAGLRFQALARDVRFHPDEALFATFARSAAVQGDWLLHGPLDKPPLTIYTDALSMTFFGIRPLPNGVLTLDVHAGEFAARVPGTFASILLMAILFALAKRLYGSSDTTAPLLVLMLAALSPYVLAFSATAFTDGLMLLLVTFALWAASRGRALEAGIALALGFWCKQQALFYLPLVWGLQLSAFSYQSKAERRILWNSLLLVFPLLLGALLLFVWDGARGQETSMWALAVANNDPGRLARLDELLPRLLVWWNDAQYLFGVGLLTIIAFGLALLGVCRRTDFILLAYVVLYFLFNWLVAFNIYDRYLLLLLPPLWLLVARGIDRLFEFTRAKRFQALSPLHIKVALVLLCVVLGFFAVQAIEGALPIGGDHGENQGIDRVAAYLDSKTLGAIIYDHWLGWELGYYLGTWSDKRRVYYPMPQMLAADALLQPDPAPRYFVAPDNAPFQLWLNALRFAGFQESLVYDQAPFVVYELTPPYRGESFSGVGSSWLDRIELFEDS